MLNIKRKRAILVESECVAVANRETIERIGHLEAFGVVHRERPEGIDRRQFTLVEVQDVLVLRHHRLTLGVGHVERIDRIVGLVGAQAGHRDDGALEIEVAVDAHRVRVHLPAVRVTRERWQLVPHERKARGGAGRQRTGVDPAAVERLPRLEADALHPRDD